MKKKRVKKVRWEPKARRLIAEAMTAIIENLTNKDIDPGTLLIAKRDAILNHFRDTLNKYGV